MSQTSLIAGGMIVAFIVFITVRGELPCYFEVLGISTGSGCSVSGATATGATLLNTVLGTGAGTSATPPVVSPPPGSVSV